MEDKTINDLTEDGSPTTDDFVASWDVGTGTSKKISIANAVSLTTKTNVGLANVTNDAQLPLAGGTMTGDINMGDNDITAIKSAGFDGVLASGSKSASFNVNFDTTQTESVTLTANTMTATLQTPLQSDATRTLYVTNGGLATLTWAAVSGTVKWVGGTVPTLTSSGLDIIVFKWDGANWHGVASLNFS